MYGALVFVSVDTVELGDIVGLAVTGYPVNSQQVITRVRARIRIRSAAVKIPGPVAKLEQKTFVAFISAILGDVTQDDVAVLAFVLQPGLLEVEEKSIGDLRDGIHCV